MKKLNLIILSLMMLISGSSISQTVTQRKPYPVMIQQNIVVIDTSIAHLIADDLVKGDECLKEIELVRANLDLTVKEVTLKDSIINTLGKQKDGLNLIISKKDEMFAKQEEISKTYKAELSKQKGISFLYKILAFAGIGSTGYLILKH